MSCEPIGRQLRRTHRRPVRRWLLRYLIGAGLVVAAVVVPVESALLPEGMESVVGESPALAQAPPPPPAIRSGTPEMCPQSPQPWTDSGSECVLELDACPESRVNPGVNPRLYLTPSFGYPDSVDMHSEVIHKYPGFCEERIFELVDPIAYNRCTTITGFVVMEHEMEEVLDSNNNLVTVHMCRVISTPACLVGLHRVGSNTCRVIKRRTWTCPPDYVLRNEFNSCYREPGRLHGQSPGVRSRLARVCGAGLRRLCPE